LEEIVVKDKIVVDSEMLENSTEFVVPEVTFVTLVPFNFIVEPIHEVSNQMILEGFEVSHLPFANITFHSDVLGVVLVDEAMLDGDMPEVVSSAGDIVLGAQSALLPGELGDELVLEVSEEMLL
jgi:hypothetical protein